MLGDAYARDGDDDEGYVIMVIEMRLDMVDLGW